MDTPVIAQYYRESDPLKRKELLDQAIASGEDKEANEIRQEIWNARYGTKSEQGGPADGFLRLWMLLEFNRNTAKKWFGVKGACKEIRKEMDSVNFHDFLSRGGLYEELMYRECKHLVAVYIDLCGKDKTYNSVLLGMMTMKKENAEAKLKRDLYETAVCVPRDLGLQKELELITRAARELYEVQFPGEGGMPE